MMYNTMGENLLPARKHEKDGRPSRIWFFILGLVVGMFIPLLYKELIRQGMKLPGTPHAVKLPSSQEVKDKILAEQGEAQSQMGLSSNEADVGAAWETCDTANNKDPSDADYYSPEDTAETEQEADPKEEGQEAVNA